MQDEFDAELLATFAARSTTTCCPEMARTCVIVPVCTENKLRFSAHLDNKVSVVRFERVAS
jgi:hypothetical protein